MASFTDTFERKEVKYRLNAKQHREVLDALAGRMAADEYGRTRITSLYFDTPTRDLIARSLEKPLYKEKLRLRWYGTPTSGERVYVEIKKKYDGIVYKRRVGCSLTAAYAYLMGRVPYENACVQNPLSDQLQQDEALTLPASRSPARLMRSRRAIATCGLPCTSCANARRTPRSRAPTPTGCASRSTRASRIATCWQESAGRAAPSIRFWAWARRSWR